MAIKLLVVDDSSFFQKRITDILKPVSDIQIIGFANNGREAIDKVQSLKPDVVTMDYEMPVMDGLTALRNIMQVQPTPVLMFSSLTYDGARVTLDALDAGAVDFLPKNFEDLQRGGDKIRTVLADKIRSVAKLYNRSAARSMGKVTASNVVSPTSAPVESAPQKTSRPFSSTSSVTPAQPSGVSKSATGVSSNRQAAANGRHASNKAVQANDIQVGAVDLVLIGTSTGGPVALQQVLTALPKHFPKPICLIQHMPASFTQAFAERLNKLCAIDVHLAQDGDNLRPGIAYLAPGGKQMLVERGKIRIIDGDDRVNYRPCVDITFASAAKHYANKSMAIVLTGMGSDGRDGAKLMKETGCAIWAQDQDSCVIYGMPMAIAKANLANAILPLKEIGPNLVKAVR